MAYETSYDSGRKPFTPDLQRGYWASPSDFLFICWGFAFNFGVYDITYYFFIQMGIAAILPYMIGGALIVVPLMVILMYMGQFSSSGFISAFRISPIFKGIGLVSLFLNLSILTYYGLFGIVSLIYLFNSLRPTLPWSCEAVRTWPNVSMTDFQLFCSSNETLIESYDELNATESYGSTMVHVPSVAYFETFFSNIDFNSYMRTSTYSFSWSMLGCNFVLWTLIALVCYQNHQAEKLGRIIRYLFCVIIGLLLVCLLRFSLLPGAPKALDHFMLPGTRAILDGLPSVPITAFHSLGSGFGMLIALASHNRFRTNIMQYSWVICIGQCFIFMGFALLTQLIEHHFSFITEDGFYSYMETHWMLYLQAGSALAHMEWANFWSILYYLMLFLACLVVMLTQLLTVITSVYDEFEFLRQYKLEFRMALIGTLALISVFFCSNHGILYFPALSLDAFFTKMLLSLLVLLIILWIYGRERFQHDIEFMLGQPFASWKVFLLRFIAPLIMGLLMIISLYIAIFEHYLSSVGFYVIAFFFILLPWLFVPGYSLMNLLQTTGSPGMRFKRICRPTDWYPLEAEDRQRYEEALGNMDITHQLHEVLEDVQC